MLTPVSTFSKSGSSSLTACPSQPSLPTLSGSAVCQMSIPLKWGPVRVRVSDALDDRHSPLVVESLERGRVGVDGQIVVYGQYLVRPTTTFFRAS